MIWMTGEYPYVFIMFLDFMWDSNTVHRFANHYKHVLCRFIYAFRVLGTGIVDVFSVNCEGENNLIVPPLYLIQKVINHLIECQANGTLIVPYWPSDPFL